MGPFAFLDKMANLPSPFDHERVKNALEDFSKFFEGDEQSKPNGLLDDPKGQALLGAIFGNAPYLTRLVLKNPQGFLLVMEKSPADSLDEILDQLQEALRKTSDMATAMTALRRAKASAALLIALADIGGVWSLSETTAALSRLADVALQSSLRFLLRRHAEKGEFETSEPIELEADCGIFILAMGKYGAGELNYSSDIDIVVFFDQEKVKAAGRMTPQSLAIRITKDLVRLMQEPTGDGYVFRTDLRLRPDAGATAVALSVDAALFYYETMGQNWERAAMIKARVAAGDQATGEEYLFGLSPFIWRRYLDYAAIEDIHSIKRQIFAHKGFGKIAIEGHNVKLGRGGIREIEFFAQTQQLIGGGKDESLRQPSTFGALDALVSAGIVEYTTSQDLKQAYEFLRMVEHRIQMVADEQTHVLPKTKEGVDHIATFSGFQNPEEFRKTLHHRLRQVEIHYAKLFEEEPTLGSGRGNLVFTGVDNDPGTLETLADMGFERPADVIETVRGWHHGRLRIMRSERTRAILTKLIPHLLEAMSRTASPDAALANFHHFLTGLPAGVQLFSMLHSNPDLMILLAEILGTAPRLATILAKNSRVLEVMLSPNFFEKLGDKENLASELQKVLAAQEHFEGRLDAARIWSREIRFRIGVNLLHGDCSPLESASGLSDVAEVTLQALEAEVFNQLKLRHGSIEGDIAIIAMGKLGSHELSATSDLDIIFVYDTSDPDTQSDGDKPLHSTQYFSRFAQRFISALQSPTAEGSLYEVDARLRPSGISGPLAVRLASFEKYQFEEAWTWEKMALTRARVITGPPALREKIEKVISEVLCQSRDLEVTKTDVREMRQRLAGEEPGGDMWQLKHTRGGLIDVEFITQYLQLIHAPEVPQVLNRSTLGALSALREAGRLDARTAESLMAAGELLHGLTQVTRFCIEGQFSEDKASESLRRLMANVAGVSDFSEVAGRLAQLQSLVTTIFTDLLGP
jgi:glutamate-ammonia-ligase adenylyltransferase